MPEPVGLVVVAEPESPALARLRASLLRFDHDALPVTVVPTPADALALAASGAFDVCVLLDERTQVIRPFGRTDVVASDGTPYTFASEERERLVAGDDADAGAYDTVRTELGLADGRRLRGRGLSAWSADVVRDWQVRWLEPRGWTFADALDTAPSADAWYLGWLLHSRPGDVRLHEPIVAMLDTAQARHARDTTGATTADLARAYVGVVLAADADEALGRAPDRARVLARSLSVSELGRAFALRCTRKTPRVQRWLGLSRSG